MPSSQLPVGISRRPSPLKSAGTNTTAGYLLKGQGRLKSPVAITQRNVDAIAPRHNQVQLAILVEVRDLNFSPNVEPDSPRADGTCHPRCPAEPKPFPDPWLGHYEVELAVAIQVRDGDSAGVFTGGVVDVRPERPISVTEQNGDSIGAPVGGDQVELCRPG